METVDHECSGENTDELISAEVDGGVDGYGLMSLSHDYYDRLLDPIDAQLSHLYTQGLRQMRGVNSKRNEFPSSGHLEGSLSLSKDTGLGSTVPTNDKTSSTPSEGKGDQTEHQTADILRESDVWHSEVNGSLRSVSRAEQCRWRLEKLLGKSSEVAGLGNEEDELTMDSICTEDFSARFRDEMLDLSDKAPDVPITSSDTADLTEPQRSLYPQRSKNIPKYPSKTPLRHLTGIHMQSFDSVTIDTDLDTVCSEKVRQHLKSAFTNKNSPGFRLSRGNVFYTGPGFQNNIQSSSSDDVAEMGGEGSKRYSRGRRHPSGRKGKKQSSQKSGRCGSNTSTERPQDKIRMDKDQLTELRLSLAKLQQQKITVVQFLERLREEMDQTKKEQNSLQIIMRDSRAQVQNIRCELHKLQAQRDVCLEQVRVLKDQQVTLVQRKKTSPSYDISCHNCISRSVSILEREEMDRLLNNTKSELFSEQRRFRDTLDSMKERLDEVNQELEQKDEDFKALQQKRSDLEKQLADTVKEREHVKESSQEALKQQVNRFAALERTVAQKELLLRGLEEEKKALHLELCSLRKENKLKLTEIENRTKKEKEQEISKLTLRLTKRHQEELQTVRLQADELRSAALTEQARAHKQSVDSVHNCIQTKDEEVKRLKAALEQYEDKMRRQTEELRRETQEKIAKALKQEERNWEEQREKALREQRRFLEERVEEAVKREREEVEKERKNTLALQRKVNELQKAEKDAAHLKETLQRSEQELQHLRETLSEKDQKHQRRSARQERQNRNWAQDIHIECTCLQELLKLNGLTFESKHLPDSPTMPEALQTLQSVTKATQQLINDLKNEISSQRRTTLQLSHDEEQELRLVKEQLTKEKEQALTSLKEKLIQEHMKEKSSLCKGRLHMNDDDTDGLFAHLRRQLQAKDDELRLVQKNMAEWKGKTTARLAHKFQLEVTAELERRVPNPQAEQQKRLERLENEMRLLSMQCRDYRESQLSSNDLQSGPDFQHSSSTQDFTSYKLLQHLQSRIRHLQAETQTPRPVKGDRDARNLGGSYLDTIAQDQESYKKGCSPGRTISS
ncbi:trichohyalin [Triplophysa rosa]|uniref:trichohyalin n=1 Tax=Triplophysa rosa TaxID=992332 RepID=UPI0025462D3C|nr:trichohyalin [Triplophysa rosa]